MLESCKSAKERWGGVSTLIDNWLNARQEMLVLYCSITGIDQREGDSASLQDKLRDFCQLLIDYVSTGHFEIYEQLAQEALEFEDESALAESSQLFSALRTNTNKCLDFNDKCEKLGSMPALQKKLSDIGEALEERFLVEDRLIAVLHKAHSGDSSDERVSAGLR
ncbi:MAG: sigma D regulator [Kistimonas sp.]|nr:sigma D regulator [Kistimonas sp.]